MPDAKCQTKMKGTLNRQKSWGIEGGWHMSIYVCITQHEFSHWGTLYTLHSRPGTIFPSWYGPMEGHVGIKAHTGLFSTSSYHQNAVALSFYLPGLFSHGGCEKQQRCTKTWDLTCISPENHPSRQPLDFYLARSRNVCPCRRFRKGSPRVGPSEGQDGSLGTCKKCWIVFQQTCTSKPENTQTHIAYPSKTCELQEISTASHHTSPIWLVYRNS